MEIILNKNVPKLGQKYDVKKVSDGYAKNFLIPNGLAEISTPGRLKSIEKQRVGMEEKRKVAEEAMAKEIDKLSEKSITMIGKANEKGHLFASIHEAEISSAIKDQLGLDISSDFIVLKSPVKEVGESEIEIKFSQGGKQAKIKLIVEKE